jgi:hypothetical protein
MKMIVKSSYREDDSGDTASKNQDKPKNLTYNCHIRAIGYNKFGKDRRAILTLRCSRNDTE